MKSYSYLVNESKTLTQIRGMAEVYEEHAAMHLSRIREDIVKSRDFFEKLGQLAVEVGTDNIAATAATGGSQVSILVTANEGLYGDIIEQTFRLFLAFITTHTTDVFVIGTSGNQMMRTFAPTISYTSISLSDTHIDEASFTKTFALLFPYRTVNIFYGKFQSIATQHAVMSTMTGDMGADSVDISRVSFKKRLMYLYEPSLRAVSALFGREINASVFNQILQESQLAKHASRMMHLDAAIEKMDESLKTLATQKRSSWKKITERKQQSRLAGLFARGDL